MKKNLIIIGIITLLIFIGIIVNRRYISPRLNLNRATTEVKILTEHHDIKEGDIIFQTSLSGQSRAIQLATNSKYSHCGLIFKDGNDFYVYEAVQPVKKTILYKWIARGQDGKYVIKRLKNSDQILTPAIIQKMKQTGNQFVGKRYDLTFEWNDDKMYCSELVWKIYQRATGIEIGKLEKLRDFDLSNDIVQETMKKRYGTKIPLDETVISPADIYKSDLLRTVKSN